MKREHLFLAAYVAVVLALTLVHDPSALAAALTAALALAGRDAPVILRRTLHAVLIFNLAVSLGYLIQIGPSHPAVWETLLRLNLRVLAITVLTFVFIARVNLFRALDFSRTLTYLLGMAYSQTLGFRRVQGDFREALISRSLHRPRLGDRFRASAAAASWFVDKGLARARESAQALRARGFFHD
jgi:cobalt/nickel transport system permease protein